MKGKQAAAAAARRAAEIEAECNALRERLKTEDVDHRTEMRALRDEVAKLRNALNGEAAKLAAEGIEAARLGSAQAKVDLDRRIRLLAERLDRVTRGASRLMSMDRGFRPDQGIATVASWALDRRVSSDSDLPGLLDVLGFPRDGWAYVMAKRVYGPEVATREPVPDLDLCEAQEHAHIHANHDAGMFDLGESRYLRRARSSVKNMATTFVVGPER